VLKDVCTHDLVAAGSRIDEYLPSELRSNPWLQGRGVVVRRLEMLPIEAIVRGHLTGSGLGAYMREQRVCGHRLPAGLKDGDALPYLLFTPTTKAEEGHDEHVPVEDVVDRFGGVPERFSLKIFAVISAYARSKGIILADTKFEFGAPPMLDSYTHALADEVATPDSSRFWDASEWQKLRADGKSPTSFDKQLVREWGKTHGIDKREPLVEADVDFVQSQAVPAEVIARTRQIYRYIFWRLTGQKLETFQFAHMGLPDVRPLMNIEVVTGSDSDLPQMKKGLELLDGLEKHGAHVKARRHVISCHRNPEELWRFAAEIPEGTVVIAGAGLAAALPGVLQALLKGRNIPVIGVAFAGKNERENLAAQLSIEQLPGTPVVLRPDGTAYFGAEGFYDACKAAMEHEFLPTVAKANKPAQINAPFLG